VAIKGIILSSMLLVGATSVHAQTPLGDLVSQVKRATVVVTSYDKNGKNLGQASGFFIAPDRVLTNVRSIDSARLIRINTFSGKTVLVQSVIARYVDADVAILQLSQACFDVVPLKVKASSPTGSTIVLDNREKAEWKVSPALQGGWNFEHVLTHLQITASLAETDGGIRAVKLQGHMNGTAVSSPR